MNTFKGIEHAIYEYLLINSSSLSMITAKTIANKNYTTTTSVNRVCKKLGYQSYTELRYRFYDDLQVVPIHAEQLSQTKTQKTHNQSDQISILVEHLIKSSMIYLYGQGASILSLNYLARFLSLANLSHIVINDAHQFSRAQSGMMILISKSGETKAVIDVAHIAKRKGLFVSAITLKNSTLSQVSNYTIDLTQHIDGLSPYRRESQLAVLHIADEIGRILLEDNG